MHCSFTLAALLVSAVVAKPINKLQQKRDIVYETEYAVVVETVYVTAIEGAPAPVTAAAAQHTNNVYWSHTAHKHSTSSTKSSSTVKTTSTPAPVPTTSTTPPAPSVQSTTSQAPVQPTSTPVVVSTTSSAPATSFPTGANTYQSVILAHHNLHRANHSAPALSWSDELASVAQQWASQCNYEHNTQIGNIPNGYGQNIAAGAPANQISNVLTDMMYNGEMPNYASYYGLDNPDFSTFGLYGHFTQIVWAATTQVGCATVQCSSLQGVSSDVSPIMTVCNYAPAGNMGGEYGTNVGRPLGGATIYGSDDVSAGYS